MADMGSSIKQVLSAAALWQANVLFPPACAGCRRRVLEPGTLCGRCWPRLKLLERPWCEVMGTPLSYEMGEGIVSAAAIADPPPFARARAAAAYSDIVRRMVQNLKFRNRTELAPWMARWMVRAGGELIGDAYLVVPVPLHRRRFFTRGFNQAAELARALSRQTGVTFAPEALVRAKATRQQVGLAQKERQANVRGAFKVPAEARVMVAGRRVLVVDDVFTTGATVSACARALKRAGAADVDVLTFARVLSGDFQEAVAASI